MTKEITSKDILKNDIATFFPDVADYCHLLIGCSWADYSASLIARAVEDCNAHLLNLDVTSIVAEPYEVVVALRASHRNPEAITRSLARYGYEVIDVLASSAADTDDMRNRVSELLHYLNI